ncbi:MAG: helix-turn-helix transcriptional regulator [Cytophagales bacterium]|nr:helix-turn-helix transcriptional regulator [Cytophagales bacterium]
MKVKNSIGTRLADLRKELGLTQGDLAEKLEGFNRDHITKLESGVVKHPKRELIAQLVTILGTTYEWLELGQGLPHGAAPSQDDTVTQYIDQLLDSIQTDSTDRLDLLRSEFRRLLHENYQLKVQNEELKQKVLHVLEKIKDR